MAKVRIVWNPNGLYDLRASAQPLVDEQLQKICDAANAMHDGFEWESHQGERAPQGRWRGTVFPATFPAMRANQRDNILLRALGGGG